jgi:3-mercaptopropionate dioxygenase
MELDLIAEPVHFYRWNMTAVLAPTALAPLLAEIRAVLPGAADWADVARTLANRIRGLLPAPDAVLEPEQLAGEPDGTRTHTLHVEPDGSFSVVALVARPGQSTRIHDHVTWCVFGVVQGVEKEDLYVLEGDELRFVGTSHNRVGDVSGFAPPGDIHRVSTPGPDVAVSIHVYGTDISRVGTSVRRYYS